MRKNKNKEKSKEKNKGRLIALTVLVTVFLISFSVSSFIIINANKLVFVKDYENYLAIMEGIEANGSKDQQIVDLTEQLERYKDMYSGLAEENQSLIKANQSLSSRVSGLEGQLERATSSSVSKPDDTGNDKDDGKTEEKTEEKTTADKKTDSKTTTKVNFSKTNVTGNKSSESEN